MNKFCALIAALGIAAGAQAAAPTMTPKDGYPAFAIGGDLSWTAYIQDLGTPVYYLSTIDSPSQVTTIPAMVADHRFDAVRLRVWVDPDTKMAKDGFAFTVDGYNWRAYTTNGRCGKDDLRTMARMFADMGLRVMVCFQMSDTWADPARQFIPQAWSKCSTAAELRGKMVDYVADILEMLKAENVNVAWVQIGNETNTGMLKYEVPAASGQAVTEVPYGCTISDKTPSTTKNFVEAFAAAAAKAKSIYPNTKTIMHIAESDDWGKIDWTLSTVKAQGFGPDMCDYIGLSLYPCSSGADYDCTALWKTNADQAIASIQKIGSQYGFRTLLCEIGMNNEYSRSADVAGLSDGQLQAAYIAQCNADVEAFTKYLVENLKDTPSNCDGFFYWEPETDYFDNYGKGACVSINPGPSWPRNKVTANPYWQVCKANSTFPAGGLVPFDLSGIADPTAPDSVPYVQYYNLQGMPLPDAPSRGLCIQRTGTNTQLLFRF